MEWRAAPFESSRQCYGGPMAVEAEAQSFANPTNALWIASNIDALNFVYLDGSDPPNVIPSPVTGTDRENIRNVQVTIVARDGATEPVMAPPHVDNMIYRNPRGNDPLGDVLLDLSASPDSFRRRIVTTTIKCRNMGL